MKYWLTTHYPHGSAAHPWFIFLKREYGTVAENILVGDRVIFVELLGRDGRGLGGVKCIATVSSSIEANPHREDIPEVEGQAWQLKIECIDHDFDGSLSRKEVNVELQYMPSNPLRILGGVLAISAEQLDRIVDLFKGNHPSSVTISR